MFRLETAEMDIGTVPTVRNNQTSVLLVCLHRDKFRLGSSTHEQTDKRRQIPFVSSSTNEQTDKRKLPFA
jgi:hypothetical protein